MVFRYRTFCRANGIPLCMIVFILVCAASELYHEPTMQICCSIIFELPLGVFLLEKMMHKMIQLLESNEIEMLIKLLRPNKIVWNYSHSSCFIMSCFFIFGFCIMPASKIVNTAVALCCALCFIVLKEFLGFSESEINAYAKEEKSIGAFWAHHAYDSYYRIIFEDIKDRMSSFEKEHNVQFLVKKVIILIPLSCDVRGILTDKDEKIFSYKELEWIEYDQGGNINRQYKNPVYNICDSYIATEYPNSLMTLFKLKSIMKAEYWKYHRNCFIKTLKFLVKDNPCVVRVYDDSTTTDPLHRIILSAASRKDDILIPLYTE